MDAAGSARGWLGPLLLRLHFYAAIFVGPFLLISAASGVDPHRGRPRLTRPASHLPGQFTCPASRGNGANRTPRPPSRRPGS